MIIGISGNNHSGKDTFGMILQAEFERSGKKVRRLAFADTLYFVSSYLFRTPNKKECDEKPELKNREAVNGQTVRDVLIKVGAFMREIDPEVWVKIVQDRADAEINIITDVRFGKEADICDKLVCIQREGYEENVGIEYGCPITNNGTLDDLVVKAKEIVESWTV